MVGTKISTTFHRERAAFIGLMSDILGLMLPEAAERLAVELARRARSDKSAHAAELPKIPPPKIN